MNNNNQNSFFRYRNTNVITDSLKQNSGILFLGGHYSNWELTAFFFPVIFKKKLNIIAKKQASRKLNKRIDEYRELSGNEIIPVGFSLKKIYEKLILNEPVCFLADQSAHPDYSEYIYFFGKKVPAFSGPAKIALKKNSPVIFGYALRRDDFSYDIEFYKIDYSDITEYNDANVNILTQRISDEFERIIKENPAQWLWFHKRFKHMK